MQFGNICSQELSFTDDLSFLRVAFKRARVLNLESPKAEHVANSIDQQLECSMAMMRRHCRKRRGEGRHLGNHSIKLLLDLAQL